MNERETKYSEIDSGRDEFSEEIEAVRQTIRSIVWRMRFVHFVDLLVRSLFYCLIGAVLAVFLIRLTAWMAAPVYVVLWLAAGAVPIAILLFAFSPIRSFQAAVKADERLDLKEKLSTSHEILTEKDKSDKTPLREWEALVIRDANAAIRGIEPARTFPFRFGKEGRYLWIPLVVSMLAALFLPEMRIFGGTTATESDLQQQAAKELRKLAERELMFRRNNTREPVSAKTEELKKEIQDLVEEFSGGELERREMMDGLAKITDRIAEQRAQLADNQLAMEPEAASLLQNKLTADLAMALEESDYDAAAAKLDELKKQIDQGKMSDGDLQRLSEELGDLSDSVEQNSELSRALEAAAASLNANDLSGALGSLQLASMSMEDLKDLAQQIALLDEMMNGMMAGRAMLADATIVLSKGGGSGSWEGFAFSGPWAPGDSRERGAGLGGPGVGRGGDAPFEENETTLTPDRISGELQKAPVIGSVLVNGLPTRGEVSVEFSDVVVRSRQAEEEAMSRENVPLTYRSSVRRYFDSLQDEETREE